MEGLGESDSLRAVSLRASRGRESIQRGHSERQVMMILAIAFGPPKISFPNV